MSLKNRDTQTLLLGRERLRAFKDVSARYVIGAGGFAVIGAVLLMMAFFFLQVAPLFVSATFERVTTYQQPGDGASVFVAMDEYRDTAVRFTNKGTAIFFKAETGAVVKEQRLPIPEGVTIRSHQIMSDADGDVLFGLSDGSLLAVRYGFIISYLDGKRQVTPKLSYPLEEQPIMIDEGKPLVAVAGRSGADMVVLAAFAQGADAVAVRRFEKKKQMFSDEVSLEALDATHVSVKTTPRWLMIDGMLDWLYAIDEQGSATVVNMRDSESLSVYKQLALLDDNAQGARRLTSVSFLLGDNALLLGESNGQISQWFPVRDAKNNYDFMPVRRFHDQQAAIVQVGSEQRRKGFVVADAQGKVGVYHATAHRTLAVESLSNVALVSLALAPRSNAVLAEDSAGMVHLWKIDNEHPEVSWEVLWSKVWYEGYPEPDYIWQSSSSAADFEPKFSLAPLAFGTLKAAFYAMLVAIPIALMAAMYAGFFMAPAMRQSVKPVVELLEALPTVIIGFLAGLWLAPFLERNLPDFFVFLILLPTLVFVFGFAWSRLPDAVRVKIPHGWEAALLIPVILLTLFLVSLLGQPVENALFAGDMPSWLTNVAGIGYDQRNSLVVGIAMGLAVIPIIFSIAEDAIYNVPKHQVNGSLALGATPWQTMVGVVLPTASPGLFSGVMIGFGRAVGETMIVLMATGNTPIMDINVFEGLRTLSANIAVEMPESEVGSTHYRVLFLAALVLFMFTFFFNTLAELVRQRMLKRYGAL
jgi:phosphate transport system permease protein